jgi:hypothetical protein
MTHVQISQNASEQNGMVGHLVWWTITEAERSAEELKSAGVTAGVPQWILDRISGRTPRAAWQAATQLGAKGKPSALVQGEDKSLRARYMTRDISPSLRGFIREVIDPNNVAVSTVLVGTSDLFESKGLATFTSTEDGVNSGSAEEIAKMLGGMHITFDNIKGKVDESRVAALVRDWLSKKNRVCVRGTGGVYLIPHPRFEDEQVATLDELLAIRNWLNSPVIHSLFSVVEVRRGGATTLETFVTSAVEELKADMEDIDQRLNSWNNNPNMNEGSIMFSAAAMLERTIRLREKVATLVNSLGDEVLVVETMLNTVATKAQRMQLQASTTVHDAKTAKASAKAAKASAKIVPEPAQESATADEVDADDLQTWDEHLDSAVEEPQAIEQVAVEDDAEDDIPTISLGSLAEPTSKLRKVRSDKGTKKSGVAPKTSKLA